MAEETVVPVPLLRFQGVVKQLGGTLAVAGIDLDIEDGEIHALLGANGAGKSTLIKLLAGVHRPDAGEILFKGQPIQPGEIDTLPIGFIHQDLGLFDWMTVAENIALVRGYPRRLGLIDWKRMEVEAEAALEIVGSGIDPRTHLSELTRTEKSIVAIARALSLNIDLLILDEPTASLPEADVARLFEVLQRLRVRGVGMIYVTHRLDEVFRLADRVTVLRDGKKVSSSAVSDINATELVLQIVGQPPSKVFLQPPSPTAEVVLEVRDLHVRGVGPIALRVMAGEILGICGLRGAGQDMIGRAISGIEPISRGSVLLHGQALTLKGPGDAIEQGIAFTSSNRQEESLGMSLTVQENLLLNPVARGRGILQFMSHQAERHQASRLVKDFSIRPADPERIISTLSGGNQQKVVLARWLNIGKKVLVMEEPTLGVDVGAKAEIYAMLNHSLDQGNAVILISSDLEEVAGICNRALILNRGRIVGEVGRQEMSIARLTALVTGAEAATTTEERLA